MKHLSRYYLFVGIPILAVVLGVGIFFDAIASTVIGNPHPQINYIIFGLIAVGCCQMSLHVIRINQEAKYFDIYLHAIRNGASKDNIASALESVTGRYDVEILMQLMEELRGQTLGSVQHAAIEAELERFGARQHRRLMLSNFMSGMMVGMGLLGTFIGLLGALAEIGNLISSFSLGADMVDPVAAITELVARLTAPMQAMSVAFSASLFGVLGSLIMGTLMVSVRSASSDLVALVQSGASLVLDITKDSNDKTHAELDTVTESLSVLAEHSPLLRGLSVALDQSERRVRELMTGMSSLIAAVDTSRSTTNQLLVQLQRQAEEDKSSAHSLAELQSNMANLAERQLRMTEHSARATDVSERQQVNLLEVISQQRESFELALREQHSMWEKKSDAQTELLKHQADVFEKITLVEHDHRKLALDAMASSQSTGLNQLCHQLLNTQSVVDKLAENTSLAMKSLGEGKKQLMHAYLERNHLITEVTQTLKTETQSRTQLMTHLERLLSETQNRNEQIIHMLAENVNKNTI